MVALNRRQMVSLFGSLLLAGCAGNRTRAPVVALLLPLSDDVTGVASSMRRSAASRETAARSPYALETFDTLGSPAGAHAAGTMAVAGGARIILGPLYAREVLPVAAVAGAIPIITFSDDGTLVGRGPFVFGITPDQPIASVLAYAQRQGVRRISIVAFDRPWGRQSIAAARILGSGMGVTIQQEILISDPADTANLAARLQAAGPPDALLLVDGGESLAPVVASIGGLGVQILGTSQWSGLDLARIPGLQGAWFASPDPTGGDTTLLASPTNGLGNMDLLPLLAHDAATIMAQLAASNDFSRSSLQRTEGFATLLGRVCFRADGSVTRDLPVLGVSPDGIHRLTDISA